MPCYCTPVLKAAYSSAAAGGLASVAAGVGGGHGAGSARVRPQPRVVPPPSLRHSRAADCQPAAEGHRSALVALARRLPPPPRR